MSALHTSPPFHVHPRLRTPPLRSGDGQLCYSAGMMLEHEIEARLEHAGGTLLALPATGCRLAGYRCGMPPIVREFAQFYGWDQPRLRPAAPSPEDIDRMDEALGWLAL